MANRSSSRWTRRSRESVIGESYCSRSKVTNGRCARCLPMHASGPPPRYGPAMGEVPLYERVRQAIAASIADGTYGPGDKLPSEARLAEDLGVNRLTVRRAIEELARAGAVESRQGSGTYVSAPDRAAPAVAAAVHRLAGRRPHQPDRRARLHLRGRLPARHQGQRVAAQRLAGTAPGPLWRIDNSLMVNGSAWTWSRSWFPRGLIDDPAAHWDHVTGLYGQLNDVTGELMPVWRAISADARHDRRRRDPGRACRIPHPRARRADRRCRRRAGPAGVPTGAHGPGELPPALRPRLVALQRSHSSRIWW